MTTRISVDVAVAARIRAEEVLKKLRAAELKHPLSIRLTETVEEMARWLDDVLELAADVLPEVRNTVMRSH